MYLQSEDYKSLWKLAHDLANSAESKSVEQLPAQVKQNLRRLALGATSSSLKVRTKNIALFIDDSFLDILFSCKHFFKLYRCRKWDYFDKDYLSSLYVRRPDFFNWCIDEKLPAPDFWVLSDQIHSNNRPKNEAEDKAVCRAIAKVYWDIDPNIHPSHMAKSKAIQKFGNGKQYTDETTVKNWIADLDPQLNHRKTGRPKDIIYKINLETGALQD